MTDCPICVETYNRSSRTPILCHYCDYTACRQCYSAYILQHPEAKCMNCAKTMTREELVRKFPKNWINTKYKEHREKYLFDLEKAMLPATQPFVEQLIERERIRNILADLRRQMDQLRKTIQFYEDELRGGSSVMQERKAFIRKCPNPDCRGFLSTQWKCNLCERKTCKECNESMEFVDEHKCDPNNVETVRLLAKDSKPCPKCGEMIFKIEGCDQMYCTQCHTAFSWRTGRVETGVIHNPHYFEWMRLNNRENIRDAARVQCAREIDHFFVRENRGLLCQPAIEICRRLIHLREVELQRFQTNQFQDNQDLRILYLQNRITEETFRVTVQKRDKAHQKKTDIYRLLAMVVQCVTEIIYRYHEEFRTRAHVREPSPYYVKYSDEIIALIEYANTCFLNISKTYNCRRYTLSHRLEIECR